MERPEREAMKSVGVRMTAEVKGLLDAIVLSMSQGMGGIKVTQTQAIELAIREAAAKRGLISSTIK